MSQANEKEYINLAEDSFDNVMSQADEKEYIMESPKSKVQNWLVTSDTDSKKNENFELKKRKSEISNPNFQSKQFCNDTFRAENHANTFIAKNSMNEKILQAQTAYERQKFMSNFFAKEQEIQLELLRERNKD